MPVPDLERRRALVLARTRLEQPPVVPELRLHLAEDIVEPWQSLERELDAGQLPPPFWALAWLGGQAVARYVLDHPHEVSGRRVLDLATGSGLCGLAARLAGAADVLTADIDPFAEAAVALNAEANGLAVEVTVDDLLQRPPPDVDVVLAGDVFYERDMAAAFAAWLNTAHARGARVLVGDPGRHYLPQSGLTRLASYDVPTTRELEGVEVKRVRVFAVGG